MLLKMNFLKIIFKVFVGLVILNMLVYVGIHVSHYYLFPKSPRATAVFENDDLKNKSDTTDLIKKIVAYWDLKKKIPLYHVDSIGV